MELKQLVHYHFCFGSLYRIPDIIIIGYRMTQSGITRSAISQIDYLLYYCNYVCIVECIPYNRLNRFVINVPIH